MSSFAALAKLGQEYTASVEAEAKQRAAENARRLAAQAAQQKAAEEKKKRDAAERQKHMEKLELEARRHREMKQTGREGELRKQASDERRKTATPTGSPKPRKQAGSSSVRRSSTPVGLTWEEKRKAREASMFRESPRSSPKKTMKSKSKTLNGVDLDDIPVVDDPRSIVLPHVAGSSQLSTRQRIAAMAPVLTKLNTEKRDLRNPLEVQMELQQRSERAAVLEKAALEQKEKMERREKAMKAKREREEQQARESRRAKGIYSDNEGSDAEVDEDPREAEKEKEREHQRAAAVDRERAKDRDAEKSKLKDRDLKTVKEPTKVASNGSQSVGSVPHFAHASTSTAPKPKPTVIKPMQAVTSQPSPSSARAALPNAPKAAPASPRPPKQQIRTTGLLSSQSARSSSQPLSAGPVSAKRKRPSSPSDESDDYQPVKKHKDDSQSMLAQTLSELFPSRARRAPVYDDDEDDDAMEVTGEELWKEEQRSARLARIEDERARREEERHEEEKRRRRLEREKIKVKA